MGCATSKKSSSHCRHCKRPYSPRQSSSVSVVEPIPIPRKSKSHRLADLISTSSESPRFHSFDDKQIHFDDVKSKENYQGDQSRSNNGRKDNAAANKELKDAESWSNMVIDKIPKIIPKTPIRTPPGEPETINAWELMEGLDEGNTFHHRPKYSDCFSFYSASEPDTPIKQSKPKLADNERGSSLKPGWLEMAVDEEPITNSNSIISEFDPEIISTFRKALDELKSPEHDIVASHFNSNRLFAMETLEIRKVNNVIKASKSPPSSENKVVIYFTSLRGVRKTYEDCCYVRMILKESGARVDERDVSMHYGFRMELQELTGGGFNGRLPCVFVKGVHIGGAEEIKQMHEDGELQKIVRGCEMLEEDGVCDVCGDVRFVPCESCSGSCKLYYEGNGEDGDGDEGGFQRCPNCNENGIVRCPVCCS